MFEVPDGSFNSEQYNALGMDESDVKLIIIGLVELAFNGSDDIIGHAAIDLATRIAANALSSEDALLVAQGHMHVGEGRSIVADMPSMN